MPASRPARRVAQLLSLRACAALSLFLLIALTASGVRAQDDAKKTEPPKDVPATQANTDENEAQEEDEAQAAPESATEVPARSVIKGRVVYDDTNRPVRRARIQLLKTDGRSGTERAGATNDRGEFRIENLMSGSYILMVDAPGIVSAFSSIDLADNMNERTALLDMKKEFGEVTVNGTNTVDVPVRARRGGVITGRVTYSDGDPAVGARIVILRKRENSITRFLLGVSPSSGSLMLKTDDRGVYRLAGLPPGEYILGAAENMREDGRNDYGLNDFGNDGFVVSYYQNETSVRRAAPVKVEAGQETGEVNITIQDRALYTMSGTVVARQGRRPVPARITIQSATEVGFPAFMDLAPNTNADKDGRWSFSNLPDGTYIVKAVPQEVDIYDEMMEERQAQMGGTNTTPSTTPPKPRPPSLIAHEQRVTIAGGDLTNVVIELSEGGRVRGTVTFEGDEKSVSQVFSLTLTARDGSVAAERYAPVSEGRFILDGVPPGEFYLGASRMDPSFYVKSITLGSTDLMREPLRIGAGANVEGVRIVMASDMGMVQGRVTLANDSQPVRGALVLLVPSDPERWRMSSAYVPSVTQADGVFKITAPPGSYLLVPLAEGETLRMVNEAFIRARAGAARSVTVKPKASETVELVAPAASP